ncbi:hypothetical protein EJB05_21450, partial [Eragrostis curvula]
MREALEKCQKSYKRVALMFLEASDDINRRNYMPRLCEDAFIKGGVRSPLTKRRDDSVQLAIICTVITNLIKSRYKSMGTGLIFAVVGAIFLMTGVTGTVETTCKEAADSDKRVDYNFCVEKLITRHDTTDADTWGLAQITALAGASNADDVVVDIKALLAKPGGASGKMREALEKCQKLYDRLAIVFLEAHDIINSRDYAVGKKKVAETMPLVQLCEDTFVKGGVRSPLSKRKDDSVQLAVICTAITNLIK